MHRSRCERSQVVLVRVGVELKVITVMFGHYYSSKVFCDYRGRRSTVEANEM
jgi:hypothetical protein